MSAATQSDKEGEGHKVSQITRITTSDELAPYSYRTTIPAQPPVKMSSEKPAQVAAVKATEV